MFWVVEISKNSVKMEIEVIFLMSVKLFSGQFSFSDIPFRADILTGGSRFEKLQSRDMRGSNYILVFRSPLQEFLNNSGGDLNTF